MFTWIQDLHVAMGGTMDPWPPLVEDAIVWLIVAAVVSQFIKRVLQACGYNPKWKGSDREISQAD